ncbi:MAG: acyl-CoA dehydrogenase family protein [Actinobacteria bacterium]|nr:acyl-CoA dehydrogenase family protein [Actinomycetota bacterium]
MEFELSKDHLNWIDEVRSFLKDNFGAQAQAQALEAGREWNDKPAVREFRSALARKGWLGLTLPRAYGGMERSTFDQFLLMDEFAYWGAPSIDLSSSAVAPTILRHGNPEQHKKWLPPIIEGKVEFAIGYSEPDAGTDLASLRTRAERRGKQWVINGEKIWNTGAEYCTHEWLACRTDLQAPKHRGISVFIVALNEPGISIEPLWTWGGLRTNKVRFQDVCIGEENLVGEVNEGWRYVSTALDFERVTVGLTGAVRRLKDELVAYINSEKGAHTVQERPELRHTIGQLVVDTEVARLLNYRAAWMVDAGTVPYAEASMTKVYTTELNARAADIAMQVLGPLGRMDPTDPGVPLSGFAQSLYRAAPYLRFGGGNNEIQRDIIAQRGFALPR